MEAVMDRRMFLVMSSGAAIGVAAVPLTACSTSWITTVIDDLPEVIQIVTSILSVIGVATKDGNLSADATAILQQGVSTFQASLTALQDTVNAYNANKTQGNLDAVIAALQAAQKDVPNVLGTLPAGVVPSDISDIIVGGLGAAVVILSSIQAIIPGAAPASTTLKATAQAAATKPALPTAASLRYGMDMVLALHGYGAQQF